MLFRKRKGFEPRGFQYKPWFYDPEKEEFQSRVDDAKRRYHGEKDEDYTPGRSFDFKQSGAARKGYRESRFETNYGKASTTRILFLVAVLGLLVFWILR